MRDQGILLKIKQVLPSLSEQERKVGSYVLELPHETVGCSITRLADACGVSNTTVSRFCRRVVLDGYRQFRIALAKEWGTPENLISHSGVQRHVVEALKLASAGGASTIALTSYPGSPVAGAADIVLYTAALVTVTAHDSPSVRTAQLAVVDVIYEAMLMKGREPAREKMARVAKAISEHTIGSDYQA